MQRRSYVHWLPSEGCKIHSHDFRILWMLVMALVVSMIFWSLYKAQIIELKSTFFAPILHPTWVHHNTQLPIKTLDFVLHKNRVNIEV